MSWRKLYGACIAATVMVCACGAVSMQGRYQESVYASEMLLCVNGTRLTGHYGGPSKEGGSIAGTIEGVVEGSTAKGQWTERHKRGRRTSVLQGGFQWNLGKSNGHWGGVFIQLDERGNERRFNWQGKRLALSELQGQDLDRQCNEVFSSSGSSENR